MHGDITRGTGGHRREAEMPKLLCKSARSVGREPVEVFLEARVWEAIERERLTREREYPDSEVSFAEAIRACLTRGLSNAQRRRDFARRGHPVGA
jgi:hypothetical protein